MSGNWVTRRDLLRMGGAAAAGIAVAGNVGVAGARGKKKRKGRTKALPSAGTNLPADRIGIQLYSVRDQLSSSAGFAKLLPRIAEIGFKGVEFAGYNNEKPQQIRTILKDYGLTPVGNHGNLDDASIEAAAIIGMPYTGTAFEIPTHGIHSDGWKQLANDYNVFGERASRSGVKGYLHLHGPAYAVVPDNPLKRGLDILLEETDPRYFVFEMDIYWAYFFQSYLGGAGLLFDPSEWVVNNRSRFPLFHVKDGKEWVKGTAPTGQPMTVQGAPLGGGGSMGPTYPLSDGITDIGQGDVPFKKFFGNMGEVHKHWYLWERDTASSNPHGSLTSARASYLMLRHDHMARPSRW